MISNGQVSYAEAKGMSPEDLTSTILFHNAVNKAMSESSDGSVDLGKIWDEVLLV